VLQRFRADAVVQRFHQGGLTVIDSPSTTVDQLEHIATLLPDEWLAPSATGTPEQCAAAVRGQLGLGADGVILHGATPNELAPIVEAYRAETPGTPKSPAAENLHLAEPELRS
jgi:alkanesulfonate monooxygenase SsuD/methylene tetrahydromethanopterin reductase-like flavin-dependent oxidoreductase (luciferase family)